MREPDDPFAEGGALESAFFLFQDIGLPMPPLPAALVPRLEEVDEHVYSTRPGAPSSLTQVAGLADEAANGNAPPYLAFSYEGHGTNTWFVRYAAVLPHVAVFLELPWGGAFDDPLAARAVIERVFGEAGALLALPEGGDGVPVVAFVRGDGNAAWRAVGAADWTDDPDALATLAARLAH
jgi:hypothetical protein